MLINVIKLILFASSVLSLNLALMGCANPKYSQLWIANISQTEQNPFNSVETFWQRCLKNPIEQNTVLPASAFLPFGCASEMNLYLMTKVKIDSAYAPE